MSTLLQVRNLRKVFTSTSGMIKRTVTEVRAVDDVSFTVNAHDTMAIVGESGCGKSTTAKCILRLYQPTSGEIDFDGVDLAKLSAEEMRLKRRDLQMIYQDPYSSLNPRMTVRTLLAEPLKTHGAADKAEVNRQVNAMADLIGLSQKQLGRYPHQFSGGQRQRVSIGRALILRPKLILADEPVSALDVSIQAQILNLLADLQEELGLTMLFISHDLNVVRHVSQYIAVMYLGRVMEYGATEDVYTAPRHPYTQALLDSVPGLDPSQKKQRKLLEGDVLSLAQRPQGCPFATRCPKVMDRCKTEEPPAYDTGDGHTTACFLCES